MEDDPGDTLRKRFRIAGGNLKLLVHPLEVEVAKDKMCSVTLDQMDAIEDIIVEEKPRLVVFDPLLGYMGERRDIHRSNQTRPVLSQLARIAQTHGTAILGIRHLKKNRSGSLAVDAGLGTADLTAAARSVLLLGKHPDNPRQRIVAHTKGNLDLEGGSLVFDIFQQQLHWVGTTLITADDLVSPHAPGRPSEKLQSGVTLIEDLARQHKGVIDLEVLRVAADELDISPKTIERARKVLKAKPGQRGKTRYITVPGIKPQRDLF